MKTTAWLSALLALLCVTRIVCTASRDGFAVYDYNDPNFLQNDLYLEKRTKPSLSIVNPLDVLRQRLLLEIARRQMKENTRQVELNRAILKNVGKRGQDAAKNNPLWPFYQLQLLENQEKQIPMQLYDFLPSISDAYQKQLQAPLASIERDPTTNDAINIEYEIAKKSQDRYVTNSPRNTKEIENEINHRSELRNSDRSTAVDHYAPTDDNNAAGYRFRYLYQLHKNQSAQK